MTKLDELRQTIAARRQAVTDAAQSYGSSHAEDLDDALANLRAAEQELAAEEVADARATQQARRDQQARDAFAARYGDSTPGEVIARRRATDAGKHLAEAEAARRAQAIAEAIYLPRPTAEDHAAAILKDARTRAEEAAARVQKEN
jgi:hypothetical protein